MRLNNREEQQNNDITEQWYNVTSPNITPNLYKILWKQSWRDFIYPYLLNWFEEEEKRRNSLNYAKLLNPHYLLKLKFTYLHNYCTSTGRHSSKKNQLYILLCFALRFRVVKNETLTLTLDNDLRANHKFKQPRWPKICDHSWMK